MSDDYLLLEQDLNALLDLVKPLLNVADVVEVKMFLAAGEYGLAFESLCGGLSAQGIRLGSAPTALIVDLGARMEIEPLDWLSPDKPVRG